jgi:hypothetical protein
VHKGYNGQAKQWLKISSQILTEEHERLQPCILKIYKKNPGLCCYATDLAQLRMTGSDMENNLLQILTATTVERIDLIVNKTAPHHPAQRALIFFADLVKRDLERPQTIH